MSGNVDVVGRLEADAAERVGMEHRRREGSGDADRARTAPDGRRGSRSAHA